MGADKMGKESGTNRCMGKILLSCEFFLFSLTFLQVQLQLLPLDLHEAQVLSSESMNVSDNSWVSQVEKGVINSETTGSRGVENGEFCVLDSSSEEVSNGVGTGMEGDSIEW